MVVAIVAILILVLGPAFESTDRGSAKRIMCLSNLKRLGRALESYSSDYDERLPFAPSWMSATLHYEKNFDYYHCPALPTADGFGYAFNSSLSRVKWLEVEAPAETIELYDSTDLRKNACDAVTSLPATSRHQWNNVAYLDGHAKTLSPRPRPQKQ